MNAFFTTVGIVVTVLTLFFFAWSNLYWFCMGLAALGLIGTACAGPRPEDPE